MEFSINVALPTHAASRLPGCREILAISVCYVVSNVEFKMQLDAVARMAYSFRPSDWAIAAELRRANERVLDRTFLKFALMSMPIRQAIVARGTGAAVLGIKASLLKQILISFPKQLSDQIKLAGKIEGMLAIGRRLETTHQQKLGALAGLKQAILCKAFSGDLTAHPKNPFQQAAE